MEDAEKGTSRIHHLQAGLEYYFEWFAVPVAADFCRMAVCPAVLPASHTFTVAAAMLYEQYTAFIFQFLPSMPIRYLLS